ncbi:MAG: DNA translocase FtsK [Bryobacteraceae bacterium]
MAQLSIADVRREIQRAAGSSESSAASSTALAGQLFHRVLAEMMGPQGWQAALGPGQLDDVGRLCRHTYDQLLGPKITARQGNFLEAGAEILALWQATNEMCAWVSSLLVKAEARGLISYDRASKTWRGADRLCRPEYPLTWELHEPEWSAPVQVTGTADALWMNPETSRWCVVEYKLGQGRPEADLAQACLYHAMLSASNLDASGGALSLLSFRPQLSETFYSSSDIDNAVVWLRSLIGRLAGVAGKRRVHRTQHEPLPDHVELGHRLVKSLQHFGVEASWNGEVTAGPTFLRYRLMPGRRVLIKAITSKAESLQVQLGLEHAPMIHNSSGRLVVDVQRPDRQMIPFSEIAHQIPGPQKEGCSRVPLGVDLDGALQFVDLSSPNNPHLLVAGSAGGGKSEWLRVAIAGLILSNTPETLRLVLIDPKRTAFGELKGSPYLLGPDALVYPPQHTAIDTLERLIEEMENRYRLFEGALASDLPEYVTKTGDVMPRIVCVCDEYADLIADRKAAKDTELAIGRLGAKARAAGIHLIIATQNPDRKTLTGALKVNLGGRVCLRTQDHIQSKMVLDRPSEAHHLLGQGDLFFSSVGDLVRLQAPYLPPEERARVFAARPETVASRG